MDRKTIEQQLIEVEQFVADGMQLVLRQKELIGRLKRIQEVQEAETLLAEFEGLLAKRLSERDRLRHELESLSDKDVST
jgi:hypothetical protein